MKMVKSLLLGSAAGLVAVTAGQAAELPIKAPAVEYVKVCSIYGAGFYYMPGTNMCLKLGGFARAEATDLANGSISWGPFNANSNTRATNDLTVRARAAITADAREETEFGVARGYISVGMETNTVGLDGASNTFKSNRAFLQWAGFTAGLSRSFFDFYNDAVNNFRGSYFPQEDTTDSGQWLWAYTAQFGGGVTATISVEDRRLNQIIHVTGLGAEGAFSTFSRGAGYGGWKVPDFVGNIRVDQTWGSAQVMGAVHQVNALGYGSLAIDGHPGDAWGWVVGAGAHLNIGFIGPGDYFEGEINYSQGAMTYLAESAGTTQTFADGGDQSFGLMSDCVFGGTSTGLNATSCHLTTGWSAIGSYTHYWTPQWNQSFTGGFLQVNYDGPANNMLCALEGQASGGPINTAVAHAGCNNDWNYWVVGSRLQWDVTRSFYVGVEALYLQQDTASSATGLVPSVVGLEAPTLCSTAVCRSSDEHAWVFTVRMHKDFLP